MKTADIIIGSNYGDEGKGLAAAYLAGQYGSGVLNILINGGPQRGHTVDLPDGKRHIFHHFGAGSIHGAASYMDEDYMVNPALFEEERASLLKAFPHHSFQALLSTRCRVTLLYDMMINQILEDSRGIGRHGSCGLGIFETRHRYELTDWALGFGELSILSYEAFRAYCRRIAGEYIPKRIGECGLQIHPEWKKILSEEGLIRHSYEDLQAMKEHVIICEDWKEAARGWNHYIFEAGQGLALDEYNVEDHPHLTPSRTTSYVSCERIRALEEALQARVHYISRSYLTRHGAGPLPGECSKEEIGRDIQDLTNMPNPYQQTLRYAPFDTDAVLRRIHKDYGDSRKILPHLEKAIWLTHLNETGYQLHGEKEIHKVTEHFEHIYLSENPYTAIYQKNLC